MCSILSPAHASNEGSITSARSYPLQLRLINDTFNPSALAYDTGSGTFSNLRRGLRTSELTADDLSDRIAPRHGWQNSVDSSLDHLDFHLGNDSTVISLTVPQQAEYEITGPEFLSLVVPPNAVTSRQRLRAEGIVRIDAAPGRALLYGTLLETPTEAALRSGAASFENFEPPKAALRPGGPPLENF